MSINYFFDQAQKAFLVEGLHPIPQGAIAVTESQHAELLTARTNGAELYVSNGVVKATPARPSPYHRWDGRKWKIAAVDLQAVLDSAKSAKLAEINAKAQEFINVLVGYNETPPFERDTWPVQREEAKAWFADNSVATPNLARIALLRGLPLDDLRNKAYQKAVAYEDISFTVTGVRQKYEDQLKAAQSLEQVQAINVVYQLPSEEVANG